MDYAVRSQLQALLFEPLLKPLEAAFGEYGEVAVNEFARALAKELSA